MLHFLDYESIAHRMCASIFFALFLIALGGCSNIQLGQDSRQLGARPINSATKTIMADQGGDIVQYALRAKRLERQGRTVRFAGRCDSACTLYLSMPRQLTCVAPGASFGFHHPYGGLARNNAVAASYMMRSYPDWVRTWIREKGGLSDRIITMSYAYARRHLPACGPSPGTDPENL